MSNDPTSPAQQAPSSTEEGARAFPLTTFFERSEEALVDRILALALERGYTRYTSTLREAWRASIVGLTAMIAAQEQLSAAPPELTPELDYADSPAAAFGVEEAKRHRSRGVTLAMFLGLMKYYRQAYQDLLRESPDAEPQAARFVDRCFDQMEVGFCAAWAAGDEPGRLIELQAENRALANEKNQLQTVFESLPVPTVLLDERSVPLRANHAAARLFAELEVPGSTWYGADGDWRARLQALIGETLATGSPERELETRDGPRIYRIDVQPMLDVSEKFRGTVVTFTDLTEERRARRQLARAREQAILADRAKTVFLGSVSHELRTPLNGVLGMADALHGSDIPADQHRQIEAIRVSGAGLLGIIDDLIDVARLETGRLHLSPRPTRLDVVLGRAVDDQRAAAAARGIPLHTSLRTPGPPVLLDDRRLRQVISRLLRHAIDVSRRGVTIDAQITPRPDTTWLHVQVSDTGVEIPASRRGRIFEVLHGLDRSIDEPVAGPGLCLPVCRALAREMGGDLHLLHSTPDGSAYSLEIPLVEAGDSPAPTAAPLPPLDVLLVEDHPMNRLVAEALLTRFGHRVTCVEDGAAAIAAWARQPFSVILMDVQLPVMSGIEATERIRARELVLGTHTPIVAVTAFALDADEERCRAAGMDGWVTKPIRPEELFEEIARVLRV